MDAMDIKQEQEEFTFESLQEELLEISPFICGLCHASFSQIVTFCKHFKEHGDDSLNFYGLADFEASNRDVCGNSLDVQTYYCGRCATTFPTVCTLHKHIQKHEPKGSYTVDFQSKTGYPNSSRYPHVALKKLVSAPSPQSNIKLPKKIGRPCKNVENKINKESFNKKQIIAAGFGLPVPNRKLINSAPDHNTTKRRVGRPCKDAKRQPGRPRKSLTGENEGKNFVTAGTRRGRIVDSYSETEKMVDNAPDYKITKGKVGRPRKDAKKRGRPRMDRTMENSTTGNRRSRTVDNYFEREKMVDNASDYKITKGKGGRPRKDAKKRGRPCKDRTTEKLSANKDINKHTDKVSVSESFENEESAIDINVDLVGTEEMADAVPEHIKPKRKGGRPRKDSKKRRGRPPKDRIVKNSSALKGVTSLTDSLDPDQEPGFSKSDQKNKLSEPESFEDEVSGKDVYEDIVEADEMADISENDDLGDIDDDYEVEEEEEEDDDDEEEFDMETVGLDISSVLAATAEKESEDAEKCEENNTETKKCDDKDSTKVATNKVKPDTEVEEKNMYYFRKKRGAPPRIPPAHIQVVYSGKKRFLACEICGVKKEQYLLLKHIRRYHNEDDVSTEFMEYLKHVQMRPWMRSKKVRRKVDKSDAADEDYDPANERNYFVHKPDKKKLEAMELLEKRQHYKVPGKRKQYIECIVCKMILRKDRIIRHESFHNTKKGKAEFDPSKMTTCEKCNRVQMKKHITLHKCYDLIPIEIKPKEFKVEKDGEADKEGDKEKSPKKKYKVKQKMLMPCYVCGVLVMRYAMKVSINLSIILSIN